MSDFSYINIYNPKEYYNIEKNQTIKNKVDKLKAELYSTDIEKNSKYDLTKLKEISSDFASLFIKMMLDELKKSLNPENDILYGGFREDLWKDMLFDEYSKKLSRNGLNSLSEIIYKSIIQNLSNLK
ncbi:MAG: rod-binding protein [Spirochaetes bacterium]|nr:rod-binding protein [Spirochaetota bacterium]